VVGAYDGVTAVVVLTVFVTSISLVVVFDSGFLRMIYSRSPAQCRNSMTPNPAMVTGKANRTVVVFVDSGLLRLNGAPYPSPGDVATKAALTTQRIIIAGMKIIAVTKLNVMKTVLHFCIFP